MDDKEHGVSIHWFKDKEAFPPTWVMSEFSYDEGDGEGEEDNTEARDFTLISFKDLPKSV